MAGSSRTTSAASTDACCEIEGRTGDVIKIGGELVNLAGSIGSSRSSRVDAAIVAVPDKRLGFVIHLAVAADGRRGSGEEFDARVDR